MRFILAGILTVSLLGNVASAAEMTKSSAVDSDAAVCVPVQAKSQGDNMVIVNTGAAENVSQVYLLKNTSTKSLWLDHPIKNPSASAGWSTYLRTGNGSALLLDKKEFALSCSVIEPGKVTSMNCVKAISLCLVKKPQKNSHRKGSYWLVEDKPWPDLVKMFLKTVNLK